ADSSFVDSQQPQREVRDGGLAVQSKRRFDSPGGLSRAPDATLQVTQPGVRLTRRQRTPWIGDVHLRSPGEIERPPPECRMRDISLQLLVELLRRCPKRVEEGIVWPPALRDLGDVAIDRPRSVWHFDH